MEALDHYGRPFHQRATEMVIPPLDPAAVADKAQARQVLGALGSGERSHSLIGRAAGGMPQASLGRALRLLTAKRLVNAAVPLSTHPSRETRYSVVDPHLRFWPTFLGPHLPEVDLVGADREPVARRVTVVGSVKWHAARPFDSHDLGRLLVHRDQVPGADADTPLLAVSRSGTSVTGLPVLGPAEIVEAWRAAP